MQLWEKGIVTDKKVLEFTTGRDRELDLQLAKYDIVGSIAHTLMLEKIGLVTKSESTMLTDELKKILNSVGDGTFKIDDEVEDIHSQIELMLTKALGKTGKKIHTARSRNDQILLDMKLYAREMIKEVVLKTREIIRTLVSMSNEHKDVLMPGYTHMQIAMPSSFGLWFGAYAESLAEDLVMLQAAYKITNQNPLGSAAGFGSSFPVDRTMTTDLLGFDSMHFNVVNAQMNRGKMEKCVAFALGSIGSTLSRMAMDVCIYSGQNFGFFTLPDDITTGSSIMPHKKNPDLFELIRAKGNKLQAVSYEISLIGANLPSGYHRDFQIIKESFFPAFGLILDMLTLANSFIGRLKVNAVIPGNELYSPVFSVEEVNKLVMQGVSFRDAYREVASKIADGNYNPVQNVEHTHEGSIGNLCNDKIIDKMEQTISGFNFKQAEEAVKKLVCK